MQQQINKIVTWIKDYAVQHNLTTLVVGISGGIDSSVVSTLCAKTGLNTIVVSLPLHQREELHNLSLVHAKWLGERFNNVKHLNYDLSSVYDEFRKLFTVEHGLAQANTKSRMRMITLYHIAQINSGLVVGTGNKVEDFGVGFFTKYGDGGVDISPIGDCLKTQVWEMGRLLGVDERIIDAEPTDGLWEDGRTDRQQLNNISYSDLEQSMYKQENNLEMNTETDKLYLNIRSRNIHKMLPIPVCKLN